MPDELRSNKHRLALIIILVVAVGSFVVGILADGPDKMLQTLRHTEIRWLMIGAACMLGYWLLESSVLYLLTRRSYPQQRFSTSVTTSMIGQLFNCITPFASGGQPIQAYHMVRNGLHIGVATSVLLAKFIIYQTVLTVYSLAVLIFQFSVFSASVEGFTNLVLVGFAVNSAVVAALLVIGFFPRIAKGFFKSCALILAKVHLIKDLEKTNAAIDSETSQFHQGFADLRRNKGLLLLLSALTALQLTLFFAVPYFVCLALGVQGAAFWTVVSASAFILMISSFVPLPGASGGAEGSFYMFFNIFFRSSGSVSIAILLWRLLTFYLPIMAGAWFARGLTQQGPGRKST